MSSNEIMIHMTGNAGSVEIDGENYIFEITNERTLYPVGSVDILIGSVRIVYETPVFPIKVKIGDIQNIIESYGVYPISVRAIDTSNRIRVIDQYYTLNVVEESETIPSVSELPVLVDVSDPAHSPDVDPEPDPGEVEEGETYYNENNKRLFVYNGTDYDKITYEGDAPTAHTHGGNDITGKVASATTADSASSVEWSNVQNPPATYAPSAHDHDSSYAPLSHTHSGSEITSAVETANKLGSTNVGNSNRPIYLNAGTATPVYQDIDPFDIPFFTVGEPSRLIAGSAMTEGYFGEVDGANFIYPWEVLAQIKSMNVSTLEDFKSGFTSAYGSNISYTFTGDSYTALEITDNLECPWLKFYSRGKIIFVSKRPILNNITWNEINTMLGDVNVGFDIKIDTHRLNSNYGTTYENGRYATLKCRLLTGANNQPDAIGNICDRGKSGVELCRGSEWNRLMYRICNQIPTDVYSDGTANTSSGGHQIGDNWAENTSQTLGFGANNDLGRLSWCREYCLYQNTPGYCCRSGETGIGGVYSNGPSGRYNFYGFRPALVFDCNPQMNIVQVSSVPAIQASNTLYIITQ